MEKYNEKLEEQRRIEEELKNQKRLAEQRPTRAGGVYIPPHKLK
jgi:hypothetical protein